MKLFSKRREGPSQKGREELRVQKPRNAYYEAVSDRFGLAQIFLFLSLLAFVTVFLLSNTGLITYQNLYYFIKDLNASAETVDDLYTDSVSYVADTAQSFTLYRKGLAIAGNSSVTVFTSSGRQSIGKSIQYRNPIAVGTGKYLLVYDLGGVQYSLYNSYTQIHTGKTEHPIRGAAISPSGSYAIVTSSERDASVVELFDSDFARVNRYTYASLVTDVAIDEKGEYLAVLLSGIEQATYATSVRFYEPGETELAASVALGDGLGYSCAFTDRTKLAVLSSNGVYYADIQGKLLIEHSFDGGKIVAAEVDANGCGVLLEHRTARHENELLFFNAKGELALKKSVIAGADALALASDAVFLKYTDRILQIRANTDEVREIICHTEGQTMLAADTDRVLLCSSQKAVYHRFE